MKGIIELIGPRQAMIGVRTEYGDYSVLELLGGYFPQRGDVISGALQNFGGGEVHNITQGEQWNFSSKTSSDQRNPHGDWFPNGKEPSKANL